MSPAATVAEPGTPGARLSARLVRPAQLRECAQAPPGLRAGVRVVAIPHVSGEHRADHAADVVRLAREEDHLLKAAVVPAGDEGTEGLDAIVQRLDEVALPVDVVAAQLALEYRRGQA